MSELNELYQEVILDHNRRPRNFRDIADANRRAVGYNPLCGDQISLALLMEGEKIVDAAFQGTGCAISKASASMMTEAVKGKERSVAGHLFELFHRMVTGQNGATGETTELGKLAVFSGVSEFPVRVKCATLAWHTLRAALEGRAVSVSTE